jgi:trk system potassium uptake protein TrkH
MEKINAFLIVWRIPLTGLQFTLARQGLYYYLVLQMAKTRKFMTPLRILVIGFLSITMLSAVLLSLPVSSRSGRPQFFVDSLFVAFSGISTTGLTPVDIGSYYNLFGQIVLLCTFQIGGIGYMALFILFLRFINRRHSLTSQAVAGEGMAGYGPHNFLVFSGLVVLSTIIIEAAGAIALFLCWRNDYPAGVAVYASVFHSISAFCTAGFSIFPDSLMKYQDNLPVNLIIDIVSFLGAIGFIVIYDLLHFFRAKLRADRRTRLTLHSKIVLFGLAVIILAGATVIFISETWPAGTTVGQRVERSLFQSISAETTDGFNTMDVGKMSPASQTFMIVQMLTGAAPGSTGGGIKITTLALLVLFIFAQLKGRENAVVIAGKREIGNGGVGKALGVAAWFCLVIVVDLLVMTATESSHAGFLQILFEIASALGNTGLSTGITAALSVPGKLLLTLAMFIGRLGPLTLGFALVRNENNSIVRRPKEEIYIG